MECRFSFLQVVQDQFHHDVQLDRVVNDVVEYNFEHEMHEIYSEDFDEDH